MGKLNIQKHDFQEATSQLQAFAKKTPQELGLPPVSEKGGLFDWFDHMVTGEELNALTKRLQEILIDYNMTLEKCIKEFGLVYTAMNAVDKDFFEAVSTAFGEAELALEETRKNQADISSTVEKLKKTISVLPKFQKQLSKLNDNLQVAAQTSEESIRQVKDQIDTLAKTGEALSEALETLQAYQKKLSSLTHIEDVDELWADIQSLRTFVDSQRQCLEALAKDMECQGQVIATLTERLEEVEQDRTARLTALEWKTKVAYVIAGSAVALSLVQLFLYLVGIL